MIIPESNARIIENPLFIEVPMVTRKMKSQFLEAVHQEKIIELPTFPVLCDSEEEVKGCLVFEIELDHMSPLYMPTSKLLVKQIPKQNWNNLKSGVYAVNYKNTLLTIKRVRDNTLPENNTLTLYANPHARGDSSITLSNEDINHIWKAEKIVSAPLPVND
ncbi:MAG TPA: hypothetical protein VGE24_06490 [Emticicia sp.]